MEAAGSPVRCESRLRMTSMAPCASASRKRRRAVLRCALFCMMRIVHALLDAFADQLLGLERGRVLFLQVTHQCFPLAQLGIAQHGVLSYAELSKWEALVGHLQEEHAAALQTEQQVGKRMRRAWTARSCRARRIWRGAPALAPGRSTRRHRRHPQPAFAPDRASGGRH